MKKLIVWAANHKITGEQVEELREGCKDFILMDIDQVKSDKLLAKDIKNIAEDVQYTSLAARVVNMLDSLQYDYPEHQIILAQPAGNPKFHYTLGNFMRANYAGTGKDYQVVFAYSKRVSIDVEQEDGTTKTTSVFKHVKFQ